jgi:hypothetical protein
MLFNNKINADGTIEINQVVNFNKAELWAYIYYLFYYNNNNLDEFINMKFKEKASAELFYNVIKSISQENIYDIRNNSTAIRGEILSINMEVLIYFINFIIHKYNDDLINPVFDYLNVLIKKDVSSKLKGIKLITGLDEPGSLKILVDDGTLDKSQINNSNIKISIFPEKKTI